MHEREPTPDPYWAADLTIGAITLGGQPGILHLQLHQTEERYANHGELFPLQVRSGIRDYVHAQPYLRIPDITVTVGLYSQPPASGAIGEVTATQHRGWRRRPIGTAQAWYYRADRTLMLWEAVLDGIPTDAEPANDPNLSVLWDGFEWTLSERLAGVERFVTPSWESAYDRDAWQRFLAGRGYQPFTPGTFAKLVNQ